MNIDNLLSVIINNLKTDITPETVVTGKLNLADFMPQGLNLNVGQTIILELNNSRNLLVTDTTGQQAEIPAQALTINKMPPFQEPVTIEAQISQPQNGSLNLQITSVNQQSPQTYLRQIRGMTVTTADETQPTAAVVKDISGVREIPLQNIKLSETAEPYLNKLPLSLPQKTEIQNALKQVEIKVQLNNISPKPENAPLPETENITISLPERINETLSPLPIKLAAQPPAEQTQAIETAMKELVGNVREFIGTPLPAVVSEEGISSALGIVRPEIPVSLPEAVAELEIIEVITTSTQTIETSSVSATDKILQVIQKIQIEDPQLYQKIVTKLPSDNENMLQNMATFTKAAVKGEIRQWLGTEVITRLENQGETGKVILSELQNALQSSSRQSPMWRIIEIPYYIENHIEQIKLAIKQYPDEKENEDNSKQKFGTRFVVDTNFTQLGAFQFDGFSFAKDRRFDLIIRTERNVGDDLCANIMKIFKKTLSDVQYVGNIKINLKENFIKISENNPDDKFLAQGLFV